MANPFDFDCVARVALCAAMLAAAGCDGSHGADDAGLGSDAKGADTTDAAGAPRELSYELHHLTDGAIRNISVIEGEEPTFVTSVSHGYEQDFSVLLYDSATGEITEKQAPSLLGQVVWAEGPRGDFVLHLERASDYLNDFWKWRRSDSSFEPLVRGLSTAELGNSGRWRFPSGVAYGVGDEGLYRVDLREERVELIDEQHDSYWLYHEPRSGRLLFKERWRDGPLFAYDAATDRKTELEEVHSRYFGFMNSGRVVYQPASDEPSVNFFDFDTGEVDIWPGSLTEPIRGNGAKRHLWLRGPEDTPRGHDGASLYLDKSERFLELGPVRRMYRRVREDGKLAIYERLQSERPQIVAHVLETDEVFPIGYGSLEHWTEFAPEHLSAAVEVEGGGWRLWSGSAGRVLSLPGASDLRPGPYGSFWTYRVPDASGVYDDLLGGVDASSGETFILGPQPYEIGMSCSAKIASGGARVLFGSRSSDPTSDDPRTVDAMLWRQAPAQTLTLAEGIAPYNCRRWQVSPGVERGAIIDEQGMRLVGFDGDTPLEIDRNVEVTDVWANEQVTSVVYRARRVSRRQTSFRLKHFDFETRQVTDVGPDIMGEPRVLDDGRAIYLVREPCEESCGWPLEVFWAGSEQGRVRLSDDVAFGRTVDLRVHDGHIFFQQRTVDEDGEEQTSWMVASPE